MSDTQDPPQLYAAHEPIFPRRVKGTFRTLKWWLMGFMLGVYYITPWLRWDRGPQMPDQAVLLDISSRRFFFFMIEIWPNEFYFVAGLLIMVERWVEGDRNARIRLHRQPWNWEKLIKNGIKWWLWLLIGLATGGAWVFYFTDAPTLFWGLLDGTASPVAYITMAVLTFTTFFFGGFAREQICIYACPWPRIQAAMMDEDTITIGYRSWRGEPRGKQSVETSGDCIDCMACVNVCPMGIDIRDGQQLACITCGLCIDACNGIMDKIGKPHGLVGYLALTDEPLEKAGKPDKPIWKHILRPRTIVYSLLWLGIGTGLVVALFVRANLDASITPVRNPPYVILSNGDIRNTFDMRLRNKHGEDRWFTVSATAGGDVTLALEGTDELRVLVKASDTLVQRLYVTAKAGTVAAKAHHLPLRIWITDVEGPDIPKAERIYKDTIFNGAEED